MKSKGLQLLFFVLLVVSGVNLSAQNQQFGPEWGENATQEQRHQNVMIFNYYKDAYDNNNFALATSYLPQLIENCPGALQSIYVYGINIYRNKINRARTLPERNMFADSLMMLYDLRMKYFGDHERYGRTYILELKAKDYLTFKSSDREGIRNVFMEAINASIDDPNPDLINLFFNELTEDYKSEILETDEYMNDYEKLAALMEKVTDPSADEAKTTFDALFINSGAANCENLEKIFKVRLESEPDNLENLRKAFNLLGRGECRTPFYFEVGEKFFAKEPSTATAIQLASAYEKNGNFVKSLEYLHQAVQNETDPAEKANLCVQISVTELASKNPKSAAEFAQMAIDIEPGNGYAYISLAQAYAEGVTACADFDRQTVYWLAYDTILNARRIFANDETQLKNVESLIAAYRSNFPSKEECFFRGLNDGASYDVRCGWISGRTTVKAGN